MSRTWLITGCSSGFGKVLAEAVLARGDHLIATARKAEDISDFADRFASALERPPLAGSASRRMSAMP